MTRASTFPVPERSRTTGHPFRRALAPRCLTRLPEPEPEVVRARAMQDIAVVRPNAFRARFAALRPEVASPMASPFGNLTRHLTRNDGLMFLGAFTACFAAIQTFFCA